MRELYPNASITVTQDYTFNPFSYAAAHPNDVLIREMDDVQTIKHEIFLRPARRRDGKGVVAESVVFGGYKIAWGESEMTAIVASVSGDLHLQKRATSYLKSRYGSC